MTTNVYDGDGNVITETTPNGDVIHSTYDPDGNLLQQSSTDPAGGDTTNFTYDGDGNILTASDDGGSISYSFTYDADGNVTQQGPWGLSLSFTYDGDGNRTGMTDSLGGTTSLDLRRRRQPHVSDLSRTAPATWVSPGRTTPTATP